MSLQQALQQALSYAQNGRLVEAETTIRQILSAMPNEPNALQLMGMVKKAAGDNDAAVAWFEKSLSANPNQPHVHNNMGNSLLALDRLDGAIASYQKALHHHPDYLDAMHNLGNAFLLAGQADKAKAILEKTCISPKESAKAWSLYGRALADLGDIDRAEDAQKRALSIKPDHVPAHHALGLLYQAKGAFEEALACFNQCLALSPKLPEAHYNRGNVLYDLSRIDEAVRAYEQAIFCDPGYLQAHDTLNKLFWQHDMGDRYLQSYANAVQRAPQTIGLWVDWADKLNLAGRCADTVQVLRQALSTGLDHADIHHRLAVAQLALGKVEDGYRSLTRAVELDRTNKQYRFDLMRQLIKDARYEEAQGHATTVLKSNPLDQEAIAYQGLVWRFLDDKRADELNDYDRFVKGFMLPAPDGYDSIEAFNQDLLAVLIKLHKATKHPAEQTLRGGSQTMGSLFAKDIPEIQIIKRLLEQTIARYIAELPEDAGHVFLERKAETFRFSGSWSVRLQNQGFHVNHVHSQGWISSCYYVDLPAAVHDKGDAHEGWIKFGETSLNLGNREKIAKIIKPEVGKLVLFPSYIYHGTVPFEDKTPRTTIAFDVVPD